MDPIKLRFLVAVLGNGGAQALSKAAERNKECETVLVPRAILSWLGLVSSGFEGDLPGVEDSYLSFNKAEDSYTGSISMGPGSMYEFEKVPLMHVAAAVAVALGLDSEAFDPRLKDMELARLGKSIDLLAKTHAAALRIEQGQALMKAISLIPPGAEVREPRAAVARVYDYSHVLPPHHQRGGFTLQVRHHPESGTVVGKVYKGRLEIGEVKGTHENGALNIEDVEVGEEHQGKGFGTALYEALMAHAHHSGIKQVAGSIHSTMASGLHRKLSRKHGMDYKPVPTPSPQLASRIAGPYDNRMGPYNYTIKQEPSETQKAEAPGPAHAATPQKPNDPPAPPAMQSVKGPPKPPKKLLLAPGMAKPAKAVTVSKSQSEQKCGLCGLAQFRDGRFRGCLCFRSLAKNVRAEETEEGYVLHFQGQEWNGEAIQTLLETMGDR